MDKLVSEKSYMASGERAFGQQTTKIRSETRYCQSGDSYRRLYMELKLKTIVKLN